MARMASLLAGLAGRGARRHGEPPVRLRAWRPSARPRAPCARDEGDLILAGGVESMSRAPMVTGKPERGFPRGGMELQDTTIGWRFVNPRMEELHGTDSMGETAENVAERYGVSREDQDAFALESHRRAVAAAEAGLLRRRAGHRGGAPAQGRPGARARRRGPAGRLVAGAPGQAARDLPRRRQRDRRQLLPHQRRRRLPGGGQRGARRRAGRRAAGPDRGHRRRGRGPSYMGVGPIPATRLALERAGPDDRRHRPGRAERGVRRRSRWPASASWASTTRS